MSVPPNILYQNTWYAIACGSVGSVQCFPFMRAWGYHAYHWLKNVVIAHKTSLKWYHMNAISKPQFKVNKWFILPTMCDIDISCTYNYIVSIFRLYHEANSFLSKRWFRWKLGNISWILFKEEFRVFYYVSPLEIQTSGIVFHNFRIWWWFYVWGSSRGSLWNIMVRNREYLGSIRVCKNGWLGGIREHRVGSHIRNTC